MVKRVVSGAHYGLKDWLLQRFTALIMLVYSIALLSWLVLQGSMNYEAWHALFNISWVRYFTLLFAFSLMLHAWVGMRDILMDYVHATGLRLALQIGVIAALLLYTIWVVDILWSVV